MKRLIPLFFLLCTLSLNAAGNNNFLMSKEKRYIHVNNRVLVTINGKAISVVDVMKKMDMIFYQQFREYADNIEARHQFYSAQWKRVLQELIDKELVMADAIEHELPISNGDVRQEMEMMLGPNIIATLDKIDMTYDEAFEQIKGDLMIQRMMMMRVNLQAMRKVTPLTVQKYYLGHSEEYAVPAKWTYQIITVRHPDAVVGAEVAGKAYALLGAEIALGQLQTRLDSIGAPKEATVSVSQTYDVAESEVSPKNLEILKALGTNEFSKPISEMSRKENTLVHRIYYLIDKQESGTQPFAELEKKIQNKLMDEAMNDEAKVYLTKLRQYYGVSDKLLKELAEQEFRPFELN